MTQHVLESLLRNRGLINVAAQRRKLEQLPAALFPSKTYYEKWAAATAAIGIERGSITQRELDAALGQDTGTPSLMCAFWIPACFPDPPVCKGPFQKW